MFSTCAVLFQTENKIKILNNIPLPFFVFLAAGEHLEEKPREFKIGFSSMKPSYASNGYI